MGSELFPWQQAAADVSMEYDATSKVPFYRTVGIDVARQNGKTTLVLPRIGTQLILPRQTVAYTAQDRGLAVVKWSEHVALLMETPFAAKVAVVSRKENREMLIMQNGSRYLPVTPSGKKAGRSLSIDLAIIDEAHAHKSMGVLSAIQAATVARPRAQTWALSNAGDSYSTLWNHLTSIGRLEVTNPASTMCWIEYSADDDADVLDRTGWEAANPSLDLNGGVSSIALADAALTMDADTFRREHLNVSTNAGTSTGIDKVAWAACRDDDVVIGDRVAMALDFTPERDRGSSGRCRPGRRP